MGLVINVTGLRQVYPASGRPPSLLRSSSRTYLSLCRNLAESSRGGFWLGVIKRISLLNRSVTSTSTMTLFRDKFSLGRTDLLHNYAFISYLLSPDSRTSEERVTLLLSNSQTRFINPQTLFIASCSRSERNGYFAVLRMLPIVFR